MSDFTAAELEDALNALIEQDCWSWHEPESVSEPNPEFDPARREEYARLSSAWYRDRANEAARDAYYAYAEEHSDKLWPTRSAQPKVTVNGVEYDITVVKDHGGGEGSGEERWVVIEVDSRLFRKEGYYASYHGSDFDGDFREVYAVTKPVVFYEDTHPHYSNSSF